MTNTGENLIAEVLGLVKWILVTSDGIQTLGSSSCKDAPHDKDDSECQKNDHTSHACSDDAETIDL